MLKWNVFIVLSIIICTCSSDNIGDYEDPAVCRLVQNGSDIEKIEIGKDRQTVLLTLYASSSWSLTCDAKWCKLSNKFGEATVDNPRTISITVDENTTSDIRNATVILSTAQMQKQLVISQSNHILAPNAEWETASEAVKNMRVGWCLGNTLDCSGLWLDKYTAKATDYEIGWGQPVTTGEMIQMMKEAGFNAIRVPVTWYPHLDDNGKIMDNWMDRVQEVVDYVVSRDMYCVLNMHHDGGTGDETGDGRGWLFADWTNYSTISAQYKSIWNQIAERFKDYNHLLVFESYNELLDENNYWNIPKTTDGYKAQAALAQDFVDVVRSTGGNNRYRCLCINTYSACPLEETINNFSLPNDIIQDRLMVQVHCYDPYEFSLVIGEDSKQDFNEVDKADLDATMAHLNKRFVSQGIPLIIGEPGSDASKPMAARVNHAGYTIGAAAKYGIVCFRWMDLLDRKNLVWKEPEILKIIMDNAPSK